MHRFLDIAARLIGFTMAVFLTAAVLVCAAAVLIIPAAFLCWYVELAANACPLW